MSVGGVRYHRVFLQSGGVDSVIHVFDGLLDLELLGVELVLELIDGGFELSDGLW